MIKRLIVLAVSLVWLQANAATIDTNVEFLEGGSLTFDDPVSGPPPGTVSSGFVLPDIEGTGHSFDGGSGGARAIATDAGVTAVVADAGFSDGSSVDQVLRAEATFGELVTNTGLVAQDFFYDFTINGPRLHISDFAVVGPGDAAAPVATYNAEVRVNGTAVFSSSASLNGGLGGQVLTSSGTPFSTTGIAALGTNEWGVEYDDFSTTLLLGNFAPGETFLFETFVEVSVSAYGFELGGLAQVGDPGDISSGGVGGTISGGGTAVPGPMTLLLLGAGLLGFGIKRRSV